MLILNETNQTRQLSLIFEFSTLLQLLTNLICSKNVGREREEGISFFKAVFCAF